MPKFENDCAERSGRANCSNVWFLACHVVIPEFPAASAALASHSRNPRRRHELPGCGRYGWVQLTDWDSFLGRTVREISPSHQSRECRGPGRASEAPAERKMGDMMLWITLGAVYLAIGAVMGLLWKIDILGDHPQAHDRLKTMCVPRVPTRLSGRYCFSTANGDDHGLHLMRTARANPLERLTS